MKVYVTNCSSLMPKYTLDSSRLYTLWWTRDPLYPYFPVIICTPMGHTAKRHG